MAAGSGKKAGSEDDKLKSQEVFAKTSSIQAIKAKEKEIAQEIAKAETEAQALLAEVKAKVGDIRDMATDEGEAAGKEFYETTIREAEEEAARLKKEAESEVAQVEKLAAMNMDKAVTQVVDSVLPSMANIK